MILWFESGRGSVSPCTVGFIFVLLAASSWKDLYFKFFKAMKSWNAHSSLFSIFSSRCPCGHCGTCRSVLLERSSFNLAMRAGGREKPSVDGCCVCCRCTEGMAQWWRPSLKHQRTCRFSFCCHRYPVKAKLSMLPFYMSPVCTSQGCCRGKRREEGFGCAWMFGDSGPYTSRQL